VLHHSNVAAAERYLGITAQELDNAYDALCENKEINSYNEILFKMRNGHRTDCKLT